MSNPKVARKQKSYYGMRFAALMGCIGWFASKWLRPILLPYGGPVPLAWEERPSYAQVDHSNDSLQVKHGKLKIIEERVVEGQEPLVRGPETIVFGNDGELYLLTEASNLVLLSDFAEDRTTQRISAKATLVADLGLGRPLGGRIAPDGTLWIADSVLGLTRLKNPTNPESKVEIVASRVFDQGEWTPIGMADDVTVGPKTGKIYFTDATTNRVERGADGAWDIMYASKVDAMRASRNGRLLQYDPETNNVTVLMRDLWFANGITVDKDESFILVVETFAPSLVKYHLSGDKEGTSEKVLEGPPSVGYLDGADCAWKGVSADNNLCYVVIPSAAMALQRLVNMLPPPIDYIIRTFFLCLPKSLAPKTLSYAGLLVVDPQTSQVVELLQDPTGQDLSFLTGVTVHDNKLYLGSLLNDIVGVYEL